MPLLPEVIALEDVPLLTSADSVGSDGLGAQDYVTRQGVRFNADASFTPLFGISGRSPVDEARNGSCDKEARVALSTDRFMLRVFTPGPTAPALATTVAFSIRAGFGCEAEEVWRGTLPLQQALAVKHVIQVSGLLTPHWQVWARIVEDVPAVTLTMRMQLDRAGGPFQLHWGPDVTRLLPLAVTVTTYP